MLLVSTLDLFALLRGRGRAWTKGFVLTSFTLLLATFGFCQIVGVTYLEPLKQAAERSSPLITAIRNYERQHGTPPPDLQALVPEFLPSVPTTGLHRYPDFRYYVGEKNPYYDSDNAWVLEIWAPRTCFALDQLLYFPTQDYSGIESSPSFQRIGDWAYLNES